MTGLDGAAGGVFNDRAREAIYTAGDRRCIGCGRTDLTCQHRRGRGMGGTDNLSIGHPANGLAVCGSGTTGTHGWIERHPADAALLGWRLLPGEHPLVAPFWQRVYGWRRWAQDPDGFVYVEYVHDADLPDLAEREAALDRYMADLEIRKTWWNRPSVRS